MVWTLRGGRGGRECADSQALRQSVGQCGAQNELMADIWHGPHLWRPSLYTHKYICTPSNTRSLCSLWQAQAVCFCGLMSPLYLSVITLELSDPKTKREPVCVPALLAGGPRGPPPNPPFILVLAVYRSASLGHQEPARSGCLRVPVSRRLTFCLPPSGLARRLRPLSTAASQGLSTVLMRISMFVLSMCVTLILLAISCFAGSRNNLCVARFSLAGWSFHTDTCT